MSSPQAHGGYASGVQQFCRREARSARQLCGRCATCGERVWLVLPYGWRDQGGRAHHCR